MSLHRYLTKQGYLIKKDQVDEQTLKDVRKDLTIKPLVLDSYKDFSKPVEYEVFQESANYLFLPRYYGITKFGQPVKNQLPDGEPINLQLVYDLLPHQITGYNKCLTELKKVGGGMLSVVCGWGKSSVAIRLACQLGGKTLIVVNKESLLDQWVEAIDKFTGGKASVGIIQQDKCEIANKDFVVAMIHTLCLKDFPKDTFSSFRACVLDECHHYSSAMFSKALPKVTSKYMLGLSATLRRTDGTLDVLHHYLGNILHSERRSGANRVLVKRFKLNSSSPYYETLKMTNGIKNTGGMVTNLALFESRTNLIIETIRTLMKEDRQILLLSGRRNHLNQISTKLKTAGIKHLSGRPITFGYYRGNDGKNKKVHKQMLEESAKCDIVLGTYSIACLSDQTKYVNYLSGEEMTLETLAKQTSLSRLKLTTNTNTGQIQLSSVNRLAPVINLNENTNQFELDYASNIGYTETKQCYEIQYDLGKIVASFDHKFYTQRGWIALDKITTNDYLVCDRQLKITPIDISSLTRDDCWLIGCLMGDGAISQYKKGVLMFINIDNDITSEVSRILGIHGMKLVLKSNETYKYMICKIDNDKRFNYQPSWLRTIIVEHNLGYKSIDKSFSEQLMMLPDDKIAGLLGGLYDTDGTASNVRKNNDSGGMSFCYNTSSYKLKNQVVFLLKRLGIQSTINEAIMITNNTMYHINILVSQLTNFNQFVDIRLSRKKHLITTHLNTHKNKTSKFDRVPNQFVVELKEKLKAIKYYGINEAVCLLKQHGLPFSGLRVPHKELGYECYKLICDHFKFENKFEHQCLIKIKKIVKIEDSSQIQLCDLHVPKNHSFLINGILVHNSEGLDIPTLNTEIMATPCGDIEQSVGRILRRFHDKVNPMVIDFVDCFGNFQNQARTRAKFYKQEDYEIQDLKLPLGDDTRDLEPFMTEISEYLSDTTFKQSKFTAVDDGGDDQGDADDDIDLDDDKGILPKGQCFVDDVVVQPIIKIKPTIKLKATIKPKPKPKLNGCQL